MLFHFVNGSPPVYETHGPNTRHFFQDWTGLFLSSTLTRVNKYSKVMALGRLSFKDTSSTHRRTSILHSST